MDEYRIRCPLCNNSLDEMVRVDSWMFEGHCRSHGKVTFDIEVPGGSGIPDVQRKE